MKNTLFCYFICLALLTISHIRSHFIDGPPGLFTKCMGPKVEASNGYYFYQYSGTQSHTKRGRKCQAWIYNWPHPVYSDIRRFENSWSLFHAKNYCRSISRITDGPKPWCYTTDAYLRSDYCDIPVCTEEETKETQAKIDDDLYYPKKFTTCVGPQINGYFAYYGTHSVTKDGYPCQRWDASSPQQINDHLLALGKPYLSSHNNYCRVMPVFVKSTKPSCYSTNKSQYDTGCNIPLCNDKEIMEIMSDESDEYEQFAKTFTTCLGPKLHGGYLYRGTQNVTQSGILCQRWDSKDAQKHDHFLNKFGQSFLSLQNNYCRTFPFDGQTEPWCYTTNSEKSSQSCGIKKCESTIASTENRKIYTTPVTSYYTVDVYTTLRYDELAFDFCQSKKRTGYSSANLGYLASNPMNIIEIGQKLEETFGNQTKFYIYGNEREYDSFLSVFKFSTQKNFLKKHLTEGTFTYLSEAEVKRVCLIFYGSKLHYNPYECRDRAYGTICLYEKDSTA